LLNKHPWDPTRVKTKLTFELLQQVDGMSSLYTQYVNHTVNREFYGLYTLLEDLDKHMIEAHGLGKKANLYKAKRVTWDLSRDYGVMEVTNPRYSKDRFESYWDIRGAKNHTILLKAYNEVFNANLDSRYVLENNFNVHSIAIWLAFVYITANIDMVHNNYAIYAPPESASCQWPTPIYFLNWDADGAWTDRFFDRSIPGVDHPLLDDGIQYFWQNRVVKRFLQVNEFVDLLKTKLAYLNEGPLSQTNIASLTNKYKPIIRPTLSISPDISHLAWDATLADWEESVDLLSSIPSSQFLRFPALSRRPMPVEMHMRMSPDNSSLFFYWSKSYILYNKPFYYEFFLAKSETFDSASIILSVRSNNTFLSLPARTLLPSKRYFWRVWVRNAETPADYVDGYPELYKDKGGWGILAFSTSSVLPPPAPLPPVLTITNFAYLSEPRGTFSYATMDNINPSSPSLSPLACSLSALPLPSGWGFANNTPETRSHIALLGLPWGGSDLVLRDGARIAGRTGRLLDGFGITAQHLIEKAVENGQKAYYANCTDLSIQRILITKLY